MSDNEFKNFIERKVVDTFNKAGLSVDESLTHHTEKIFQSIVSRAINEIEKPLYVVEEKGETVAIGSHVKISKVIEKALDWKIRNHSDKKLGQIVKEDCIGIVVKKHRNGEIEIYNNIEPDIAEFLSRHVCGRTIYEVANGNKSNVQSCSDMYGLLYEYIKRYENYIKKQALLGSTNSLLNKLYENRLYTIEYFDSREQKYRTAEVSGLYSIQTKILPYMSTKDFNAIDLFIQGYTLKEIEEIVKGVKWADLSRTINIYSICNSNEISIDNLAVKLANNIKLDKAIDECIKYKEEKYDAGIIASDNNSYNIKLRDTLMNVIRDIEKEEKGL